MTIMGTRDASASKNTILITKVCDLTQVCAAVSFGGPWQCSNYCLGSQHDTSFKLLLNSAPSSGPINSDKNETKKLCKYEVQNL